MLTLHASPKVQSAAPDHGAGSAGLGFAVRRRLSAGARWLALLTLAALPWQGAQAVIVTLGPAVSQTGAVSMTNSTSPVPSTGALNTLASQLGVPPTGFAYIDTVVPLTGGGLGATFNSGSAPAFNTVVNTRPGIPDWESIAAVVPLTNPLALVAQPRAAGVAQNTAIYGFDYTAHGLPGSQYFISGVVNGTAGGALSLGFTLPQTQFGFNIAGLDSDQPVDRLLYIDFYDAAGQLVDLLTITIPRFTSTPTSTIGTSIVAFQSTTPFYGMTLTTDDPGGLGTGDFRYVVPTPSPLPATVLLLLGGGFGLLATRRYGNPALSHRK